MLPAWGDFVIVAFNTERHITLTFVVRAEEAAVPIQPLLGIFNLEMMERIEKQVRNLALIQPQMQIIDLVVPVVAHDPVPVGILLYVIFPKLVTSTKLFGNTLSHIQLVDFVELAFKIPLFAAVLAPANNHKVWCRIAL